MTEITAAMVKQLRDATSAGMMDCKRALQETDGDFDEAVKVLREKGMASAAKRADRETSEGIVLVRSENGTAAIAAVGCETEPVSKNEDFLRLRRRRPRCRVRRRRDAGPTSRSSASSSPRSSARTSRSWAAKRLEATGDEYFDTYVHAPANKVGAVVHARGGLAGARAAARAAHHVRRGRRTRRGTKSRASSSRPSARCSWGPDEVQSKPEDVREKIVEGMLNKRFYGESVLTRTDVDPRQRARRWARRSSREGWSSSTTPGSRSTDGRGATASIPACCGVHPRPPEALRRGADGHRADYGLDAATVDTLARELVEVHASGLELALVIGGGNIYRGMKATAQGMDRATGDYMGMLATVFNSLAVQESLERNGADTRVLSALDVREVAEPYIRRRAIRHLEKGRVVIFAAGTGNPYFTTDTAAALRALEIDAEAILMAKNGVAGVFDGDPRIDPVAPSSCRRSPTCKRSSEG